jgi:hypothetical protein
LTETVDEAPGQIWPPPLTEAVINGQAALNPKVASVVLQKYLNGTLTV